METPDYHGFAATDKPDHITEDDSLSETTVNKPSNTPSPGVHDEDQEPISGYTFSHSGLDRTSITKQRYHPYPRVNNRASNSDSVVKDGKFAIGEKLTPLEIKVEYGDSELDGTEFRFEYKNEETRRLVHIYSWLYFDKPKPQELQMLQKRAEPLLCYHIDVWSLKSLFHQMGYSPVDDFWGMRSCCINPVFIERFETELPKELDSFIGVFLSHGRQGRILLQDNEELLIKDDIVNKFLSSNLPQLDGKPKVLIFQSCRTKAPLQVGLVGGNDTSHNIPVQPGYFIVYSSMEGELSYINSRIGSPFIRNFCRVTMKKAKDTDLVNICHEVNKYLKVQRYEDVEESECRKISFQQCDINYYHFDLKFYFNPLRLPQEEGDQRCETDFLSIISPTQQFRFGTAGGSNPSQRAGSTSSSTSTSDNSSGAPTQLNKGQDIKHDELEEYQSKKMYFVNSLEKCEEDINKLSITFEKMGYETKSFEKNVSYINLKKQIEKSEITVVFFFGWGFGDYIYLKEDIVSYRAFGKMFCSDSSISTIMFTNTWFQRCPPNVSHDTVYTEGDVSNTYHFCIKVNGVCDGSLLSEKFVKVFEDFEKSGGEEEFSTLANRVAGTFRENKDYIMCFWHYKCTKSFHFSTKTGSCEQSPKVVTSHSEREAKEKGKRPRGPSPPRKKLRVCHEPKPMEALQMPSKLVVEGKEVDTQVTSTSKISQIKSSKRTAPRRKMDRFESKIRLLRINDKVLRPMFLDILIWESEGWKVGEQSFKDYLRRRGANLDEIESYLHSGQIQEIRKISPKTEAWSISLIYALLHYANLGNKLVRDLMEQRNIICHKVSLSPKRCEKMVDRISKLVMKLKNDLKRKLYLKQIKMDKIMKKQIEIDERRKKQIERDGRMNERMKKQIDKMMKKLIEIDERMKKQIEIDERRKKQIEIDGRRKKQIEMIERLKKQIDEMMKKQIEIDERMKKQIETDERMKKRIEMNERMKKQIDEMMKKQIEINKRMENYMSHIQEIATTTHGIECFEQYAAMMKLDNLKDEMIQQGVPVLKDYLKRFTSHDSVSHIETLTKRKILVDDIFSDLILEGGGGKVSLENILDYTHHDDPSSLLILKGQAGVGKTTIIKRITSDWINKCWSIKGLQSYDMVFCVESQDYVESFRDLMHYTLGKVSKKLKDRQVNPVTLELKCLVIIDGYDNSRSYHFVKEVLALKKAHNLTIIVTSRPEAAEKFYTKEEFDLQRITTISLEGISEEKVQEFVQRYYESIHTEKPIRQIEGLLNHLEKTMHMMRDVWKLPYNLCLLTNLWKCRGDVKSIITDTELQWNSFQLNVSMLKERLHRDDWARPFPPNIIDEMMETFLWHISKQALDGLIEDNLYLVQSVLEKLTDVSRDLSLSAEELICAFLKKSNTWKNTKLYSFLHKGSQEFFAAHYLLLHLTGKNYDPLERKKQVGDIRKLTVSEDLKNRWIRELTSNTSSCVTLSDALKDLFPSGESLGVPKYQNLLYSFITLTQVSDMTVSDDILIEALLLFKESGMNDRNSWIRLLTNAKLNKTVANWIHRQCPSLLVGDITINDYSIYTFLPIIKEVQQPLKSEINLLIELEKKQDMLNDLAATITAHELEVQELKIPSLQNGRKTLAGPSQVNTLLQLVQICHKAYSGIWKKNFVLRTMKISPEKQKSLCVKVEDHEDLLSLHKEMQTVYLHRLMVCVEADFFLEKPAHIPDERVKEILIEVQNVTKDKLDNVSRVIQALRPQNKRITHIRFRRLCPLDERGYCFFLESLSGVLVAETINFPESTRPYSSSSRERIEEEGKKATKCHDLRWLKELDT